MSLPAALLLGGGPIAPPVARSLGSRGVSVVALGAAADPVRHSRFCRDFVDLGAGAGVQERWLEWLGMTGERGAVLLPCNDDALELIAHNRPLLESLGHRPVEANDEVVLAMLDKHATYELAREAGVRVPRTALLAAGEDPAAAVEGMAFPIALKPRQSHLFARHFGIGQKVFLAHDFAELERQLERLRGLGLEMLTTEIIPGPDDAFHSYYTYVDEQGTPLFDLTKRKLRQFPVRFGLSTYHAIDRHEETIEIGRRFVTGVGLRGVACVEFKRDARDGELKLIECNHRFTLGYELVRHAGIDVAWLAYARGAGLVHARPGRYRRGVTMWHPVEDTRAFLTYRRRGELTAAAWLGSLLRPQHFPLFAWNDPRPSLVSLSRFPARLLRRPRPSTTGPRPATAEPQDSRARP
jgi:D-aspartate ligase